MVLYDKTTKAWHDSDTHPLKACCGNTEHTGVNLIININLHDYPETGTSIPYPIIYGYLNCPRVDAQSIILPSKLGRPLHGFSMAGLDPCQ